MQYAAIDAARLAAVLFVSRGGAEDAEEKQTKQALRGISRRVSLEQQRPTANNTNVLRTGGAGSRSIGARIFKHRIKKRKMVSLRIFRASA